MSLPTTNNVYGLFRSGKSLEKLAKILRRSFSDSLIKVAVRKSSFSGVQTLTMESDFVEFETLKLGEEELYSFNGSVAGSKAEVDAVVCELFVILSRHDYDPSFEIYDSAFKCIGEFGPQR